MDEPEAAFSCASCPTLVGLTHDLAATGSQIVCATHFLFQQALMR
jgi:predicted ATPase